MTKVFKLRIGLLFLGFMVCFSTISCGDDEEPTTPDPVENPDPDPIDNPDPDPDPEPDPLDSAGYEITFSTVRDAHEVGNASDVQLVFDAPTSDDVTTIRIFAVMEPHIAEVNAASIAALTSSQFMEMANDKEEYDINLTEGMLDLRGETMALDTNYVFYALTNGTYQDAAVEILSGPSQAVSIVEREAVTTLVSGFIADDGLTIDADGNIYGSEFTQAGTGTRIIKVTPAGETSVFADGLSGSLGNVFDADGNFYVTNNNNAQSRKIVKITPDGVQSDLAVVPGYPAGLIVDPNGHILVSNYSTSKIYDISPSGDTTVYIDDDLLAGAVGMAYDDDGNLIAGNYVTGDILSISPEKQVTKIASIEVVVTNAVIGYLTYLEGHIYATGIRSNKIYKVSLDGQVEVFAGTGANASFDAPLLEAKFSGCNGITADKQSKTLYISQFNTKALRKIELF